LLKSQRVDETGRWLIGRDRSQERILIVSEPDGFSSRSERSRRAEHFLIDGSVPLATAAGVRVFGIVFCRVTHDRTR